MHNEDTVKNLEAKLAITTEELNRLKSSYDDFIHLAAHDLQAPVRKITTLLDRFILKTKDKIPEEAVQYLDRINNGLEQMTSMVNDITQLSQIKSSPEKYVAVDLNDLLTEVLRSIHVVVEKNEAKISFTHMPVLNGNKEELKKLFSELLINSIKFRKPEDFPIINVDYSRINEEEKIIFGLPTNEIYAKITVKDNGMGFDPSQQDKVLKPFLRLNGNSSHKGNGMGLAICKKIVETHSGILFLAAKINEGTICTIILPEIQI